MLFFGKGRRSSKGKFCRGHWRRWWKKDIMVEEDVPGKERVTH
jgi:hypothetical protein